MIFFGHRIVLHKIRKYFPNLCTEEKNLDEVRWTGRRPAPAAAPPRIPKKSP